MTGRVKALILAAGVGSRLRPLTDRLPKCLVPVRGRPILDLWLEKLVAARVYHALINTHAHAEKVHDFVSAVTATGLIDIRPTFEPELLGSAGTVAAHPSFADDAEDVVVIYPDNVSEVDLTAMLAFHRSHTHPLTMLLFRAPNPRACGIAEVGPDGTVVSFVEKPREPRGDLANAGVYILRAGAYREVAALGARDFGFEVLPRFVGRMAGFELAGFHRDIGTPLDLEQVEHSAAWIDAARAGVPGRRPAVFLDRDGTVIEQVHYIRRPQDVRLIPGAARAIRRLKDAGFACVTVSNQAGIGRGVHGEDAYHAVQSRLVELLAAEGVRLDGSAFCPARPASEDRRVVDDLDRKPGPGMLLRLAREHRLDTGRSWMVGDLCSDALAGVNAGCRGTVLLRCGLGPSAVRLGRAAGVFLADDLDGAAGLILGPGAGMDERASQA